MKTKVIILVALLSVICTGCKKHECDQLSWTDYNTVEDVYCNFKYFVDENKAHIGDTLKVFGWLYRTREVNPDWQYLTSHKEVQFCLDASQVHSYPIVSLNIYHSDYNSLMPENPYDSLLYVTGVVEVMEEAFVPFYIRPFDIKKTPNNEE